MAEVPFVAGSPLYRVIVDIAPEGQRPWPMLLDTGATHSVVTPRAARELGVTVRRAKSTPYRKRTRLGRDLQFWVDVASSDTASRTGWEYGLLGGDFLDDYVVEIDVPRRRVRFLDPRRYEVPKRVDAPDERVLPFRLRGTRISVPVELSGKALDVLFDTGAPTALILSGAAARKLAVDVEGLPEWGAFGSTLGPVDVRFHEAPQLTFAGFAFEGLMPVFVAPRGWYNMGGPNDSALGMDVLRPFVLRIDYRRRRLWLRREAHLRTTLLGVDYALVDEAGVILDPLEPGRFEASSLRADGPAAQREAER